MMRSVKLLGVCELKIIDSSYVHFKWEIACSLFFFFFFVIFQFGNNHTMDGCSLCKIKCGARQNVESK